MLDYSFKETEIMKIDLHKMKVWEAAIYLNNEVAHAPRDIKEIIVIPVSYTHLFHHIYAHEACEKYLLHIRWLLP